MTTRCNNRSHVTADETVPLRACADMRCVINDTSSDVSRCCCLCSVCSLSYSSSSSSSGEDNILAVVRSSHEELDDENDDEAPLLLLLLSLTLSTEYAN
jgi:hypothetical protein